MRKSLLVPAVLGLVLGAAPPVPAQQDEARAIIDKAIRAHGGADNLAKLKAIHNKARGVVQMPRGTFTFTQEAWAQLPKQLKEVMSLEGNGERKNATTVLSGDKGWMKLDGGTVKLPLSVLDEMKESAYRMSLMRFTVLKDGTYDLAPLPEIKVNGRPAVGVKVSPPGKGHKEVRLYFDKQTGLAAKMESRAWDPAANREVTEERFFSEYRDVDGVKSATRVLILHDGKRFMEAEVTETKFPDKIDEREFAEP